MIVVDSNVLAARSLTGVQTSLAQQVEQIDPNWIVPPLWRYEFQNILTKAIWDRQLAADDAIEVWRQVESQMSGSEHEPAAEEVLALSARYRITAYDANFIVLALEMRVPCITEDGELRDKFPGQALSMDDFIKLGRAGTQIHEARVAYTVHKRIKKRG